MTEEQASGQPALPSDEELWASFVQGEDDALSTLIARYREELFWYLLLSTGKQRAAGQHLANVWEVLARYRRPYEGFGSFKSWLYACATQMAAPPAHPEELGLTDLLEDLKRGKMTSRRAELFFLVSDMARVVRQPFLLVTVVGLDLEAAARACRFTAGRTLIQVEKAYRRLARSGSFARAEVDHEVS